MGLKRGWTDPCEGPETLVFPGLRAYDGPFQDDAMTPSAPVPTAPAFAWGDVTPLLFAILFLGGGLAWALFFMRKHPKGLRPLFMTEMWERFSFYGMRALLALFMVAPVEAGGLGFPKAQATMIYGTYGMCVYLMSIPGGWVADRFLGYRKALILGGVLIAGGQFLLTIRTMTFFVLGLSLIVIGTGLLKTNCTSLVGMLYPEGDPRRDAGFSIYYMGINLGAFISPLVCGFVAQTPTFLWLLGKVGIQATHAWTWGFAAAGLAMLVGLVQYRFQRNLLGETGLLPAHREAGAALPSDASLAPALRPKAMAIFAILGALILAFATFDFVPAFRWPVAIGSFAAGAVLGAMFGASNWSYVDLSPDERKRVYAIGLLFCFAMVFWAIFEQAGTTLNFFADQHTDRVLPGGGLFPSSYYQSVNSVFIILLAPAFSWLWMYLGTREPSSPVKFSFGLVGVGLGFLLLILPVSTSVAAGAKAGPWWLVGTYFLHTVAELALSPVGLSTTSKLAPSKFKGLMMGVWFLSIAFGYKLGGFAGHLIEKFSLGTYFLGCFILTVVATVLLLLLTPAIKRMMGSAPAA
jgi:POT family proton-dependent oligopeptide transporter